MKEKQRIDKEQVTMPMERYNELMQLESEVYRLKSTHRAKTIVLSSCVIFLPFSSGVTGYSKTVETDDAAVEQLAIELKKKIQEEARLMSMNIFQICKWKIKQSK